MANKNIWKAGAATQFSSLNQPENRGRRPSVLAKYIRENRVSLSDIQDLISSLLGYSADEIQAILKDKTDKPPVGIILILKAIMADMDKGEIANFEKLLDRSYGKPERTINHDIDGILPETFAKLSTIFRETKGTKTNEKNKRKTKTKTGTDKPVVLSD